jgi:YgiT-type zinc finger domain-containing protein
MTCYICETGQVRAGKATMTLEREGLTLVVNGVPAQICQNCGENYIDQETRSQLLKIAERGAAPGVSVDIREFATAMSWQGGA